MSNNGQSVNSLGAFINGPGGLSFIPEPKTSSTFSLIKNGLQDLANVVGTVAGQAGSIVTSAAPQIDGEFQNLITLQLEAQKQMMLVSMVSNVEKSKHETDMAPVRNIRVG